MSKRSNHKLEKRIMFNAYSEFWNKYRSELKAGSMLQQTVDAFLEGTQTANSFSVDELTGLTASKQSILEELESALYEVLSALSAYADFTNDVELKRISTYTKTRIIDLGDMALMDLARNTYPKAKSLEAQLEEFVTAEEIEELNTLSQALQNKINERTATQTTNAVARGSIEDVFSKQMQLRDTLKKMVVNFKKGDLNFHREHDLARKIHYPKPKKKEEGNGEPKTGE